MSQPGPARLPSGRHPLSAPAATAAERVERGTTFFRDHGYVMSAEPGDAVFALEQQGGELKFYFGERDAGLASHGFLRFRDDGAELMVELARSLERPPWFEAGVVSR